VTLSGRASGHHLVISSRLIIIAALLTFGCDENAPPSNLVLITIDTLRADHLTPYGYERNTSPFLQKLAHESFLFEDAISQCGTTPQSFSSIMTGLYPYTDGILVQNGPFFFLKAENTTLAQALSDGGYRTHAITSSIQTSPVTGVDSGFETFDAIRVAPGRKEKSRRRRAEEVTALATGWLRGSSKEERPFFLWVHYLDPHGPYRPPATYSSLFSEDEPAEEGETRVLHRSDVPGARTVTLTDGELARQILLYDREVRYTDESIGTLFREGLQDLLANTVVILTADHGEALGNHDVLTHSGLYQTIIHVPLFIRLPGRHPPSGRIASPVMLVDLLPTSLDLLGLPWETPTRGRSLRPLLSADGLRPAWQDRVRLAEYSDRQAILYKGFKLIVRGDRRELYDLRKDRYESADLSGTMKEYQDMLVGKASLLKDHALPGVPASAGTLPEITPEMLEELEALGYVVK
jgi:arylsulfatase